MAKQKIKTCYVLSYKHNDYVRTQFLISALQNSKNIELSTAINNPTNLLRYLDTIVKLIIARLKINPDVYILGFRGYEIFWPVRIITMGKPLIFDEFINLYEWATEEHKILKKGSAVAGALYMYARLQVKFSQLILADTKAHASLSSSVYNQNISKYIPVYVGTNERLFKPRSAYSSNTDKFNIFFYANFLPLHGVPTILDAVERLNNPKIHLTIVGASSNKKEQATYEARISKLAQKGLVTYKHFVSYDKLPEYINNSDLCLGGPFGGTGQGERVITGKTFQFIACAKPTVVGINQESGIFTDKKNALLVEQNSTRALSEVIAWSYSNRKKLKNIGLSGRKLYEQEFSAATQSNKLQEAITRLI